MTKAMILKEPGKFAWEDIEVGDPGRGQARLRHTAVGLNFLDTHFADGSYPAPGYPCILGFEAAGVVEAIGDGVSGLKAGDRVGYCPIMGSFAQARLIDADLLIPLPESVSDEQAAAQILKGMTAQYLLRQSYRVQSGDTILIHAAAGGVGALVCQWAKHLGATVIGTVSSEAKAEFAKARGCDHTINYSAEDFAEKVNELTDGAGVDAVYESIGKDTFLKSYSILKPLGTLVMYGHASGPVPPEEFSKIPMDRYYIRTTLQAYTDTREDRLAVAKDLFDTVAAGGVKLEVGSTRPLSEADKAIEDLESRKTTGATVLIP